MAWNRHSYDEIFTRYYANISDITNADPGVITADSVDPDLDDDHGFQTNDFVYIDGIDGPERLNYRIFRATRASATTLTLQTLDNQDNINTTDYETYDGGGTIYHVGLVLPASTIQPANSWTIKRLFDVHFDHKAATPITKEQVVRDAWLEEGGRPEKWRYEQYTYSTFESSNIEHWLFWYGLPTKRYNVNLDIEKTYPDISTFKKGPTGATYPPHPIDIHDYIWHRALANLATQAEKQRRTTVSRDGKVTGDNTKIEIVNANYWISKMAADEIDIMAYHNSMLGNIPTSGDSMGA